MKITYLIFAHNNLPQLQRLIMQLNAENVDFFCHIDAKCSEDYSFLLQHDNVQICEQRHSIDWGGITQVQALLACCRELCMKYGDGEKRMVCLLSGYDYPIKSNEYIYNYFSIHYKLNFISAIPIPNPRSNWTDHGRRRIECYAVRLGPRAIATIEPKCFNYTNMRQLAKVAYYNPRMLFKALSKLFAARRVHPDGLQPYGGEFWWALPLESIQNLLSYVDEHPEFLEYHRNTSNPDELFFQTLVYNLFPKEFIADNCLRWVNWKGGVSPQNISLCDKRKLQVVSLKKDILFVRKVADGEVSAYINSLINT